ncbi:MAG: ABC transporter permease [Gemmatales bacterium]|nr:MAG: ABC transporter permease [Gemmatales bacterium]
MSWIAWKMLTGDRSKYMGIIFGVTFASLLIAQQTSIFCGLMLRTTSQIRDIRGADIWVMDANVQYIDDLKPLSDIELYRVRGVSGVKWAVPLYKGLSRARLEDGNYQQVILIGVDDATLVGAPEKLYEGSLSDLRLPDAIIMDRAGYRQLWPGEPFRPGRTFEMNDRRAVIVGICDAQPTFQTFPVVFTRYTQAQRFVPRERKLLSFVLAEAEDGIPTSELCRRIEDQTGLRALTGQDFAWKTMVYYLTRTGIPINFGTTVLLGFFVGVAIAGQTFYTFTVENLKQFGTLKAMGLSNARIVGMILLQAVTVGAIGYGLGVGLAALFGIFTQNRTKLAFYMPWWVLVGTGAAVLLIVVVSSLLSVRRVIVLEPAIVFR